MIFLIGKNSPQGRLFRGCLQWLKDLNGLSFKIGGGGSLICYKKSTEQLTGPPKLGKLGNSS